MPADVDCGEVDAWCHVHFVVGHACGPSTLRRLRHWTRTEASAVKCMSSDELGGRLRI